jgi:hypothetical protein
VLLLPDGGCPSCGASLAERREPKDPLVNAPASERISDASNVTDAISIIWGATLLAPAAVLIWFVLSLRFYWLFVILYGFIMPVFRTVRVIDVAKRRDLIPEARKAMMCGVSVYAALLAIGTVVWIIRSR